MGRAATRFHVTVQTVGFSCRCSPFLTRSQPAASLSASPGEAGMWMLLSQEGPAPSSPGAAGGGAGTGPGISPRCRVSGPRRLQHRLLAGGDGCGDDSRSTLRGPRPQPHRPGAAGSAGGASPGPARGFGAGAAAARGRERGPGLEADTPSGTLWVCRREALPVAPLSPGTGTGTGSSHSPNPAAPAPAPAARTTPPSVHCESRDVSITHWPIAARRRVLPTGASAWP